jgi:hypothetical protein
MEGQRLRLKFALRQLGPRTIIPAVSEEEAKTSRATFVDTASESSVTSWVGRARQSGQLRNCVHLVLKKVRWWVGPHDRQDCFIPWCQKNSFVWSASAPSRQEQIEILATHLEGRVIACPPNCSCYEDAAWTAVRRACRRTARQVWRLPLTLLEHLERILLAAARLR